MCVVAQLCIITGGCMYFRHKLKNGLLGLLSLLGCQKDNTTSERPELTGELTHELTHELTLELTAEPTLRPTLKPTLGPTCPPTHKHTTAYLYEVNEHIRADSKSRKKSCSLMLKNYTTMNIAGW